MTKDERAEARKRCEKATPGPFAVFANDASNPESEWSVDTVAPGYLSGMDAGYRNANSAVISDDFSREADARFWVAARTDLPAALDTIDALEAERDQLHKSLFAVASHLHYTMHGVHVGLLSCEQDICKGVGATLRGIPSPAPSVAAAGLRERVAAIADKPDQSRAWMDFDDPVTRGAFRVGWRFAVAAVLATLGGTDADPGTDELLRAGDGLAERIRFAMASEVPGKVADMEALAKWEQAAATAAEGAMRAAARLK